MRPPSRWAALKTGVMVSAAAALVFLAVLFSDALLSIFVARVPLYLAIEDVQGLRTGAPVWLLGVEVGLVDDVQLIKGGTLVELSIDRKSTRYIHEDAMGWVRTLGLLGDKYVDLEPGTTTAPRVEPGDTLPGQTAASMDKVIEASFASIGAVETFVSRLDTLLMTVRKGNGTLAQLLYNEELYDNLAQASEAFADVGRAFTSNRGTVRLLLEERELYDRMVSAVSQLETLGDTLLQGDGTLPRLINEPTAYRELIEGLGVATAILDSLYRADSPLGVMLRSRAAGNDLQRSLTSLRMLLEDMQQNPGKYFKFELF
ncbi:MAG: MCE family protein [Chitinivibrionales bacterium]|nr:MCE family protein [Chitinivibrionales bacterium]